MSVKKIKLTVEEKSVMRALIENKTYNVLQNAEDYLLYGVALSVVQEQTGFDSVVFDQAVESLEEKDLVYIMRMLIDEEHIIDLHATESGFDYLSSITGKSYLVYV